jgi:hypothetical protein
LIDVTIAAFPVFLALAPAPPGEQFTLPAGLPLASATLGDVREALGPADVWEEGAGGEHYTALCYVAATEGIRVTFMSGFPGGGGPRQVLTGVTFARGAAAGSRCRRLSPPMERTIAAGVGGLRLGMRTAEFKRLLGQVKTIEGGRLAAGFEHSRPLTSEELAKMPEAGNHPYADTAIFVAGSFAADRLVELTIEKSVTY